MKKTLIQPLPDPFEPFALSPGIAYGDLLFISGQAALDPQGQIVGAGDFMAQAECAFGNLQRVLETAGAGLEDVLKVTIFVTDMTYFPEVVALRKRFFRPPYPADSIVQVSALALPELMFEIEAIAARPKSGG
ncbi:RidA family protein [Pseudomonas saudiphocaensis]|uniref:Endoribonuclease L-PSP n=1 Tax=Pseudomonas saudiphocaensis TaxID=1499686 RepID=A0A078LSE8_9PSED|nr:RidA family protein [Pseudomonas saudiphocaensis]MBE7927838.1 RidA family protein [Pseudomonas saudiphocaensis]RRV16858.1 RidA family protein [Pseudomonas saudiphocaensis]CDZ93282.1 endoribonuclease L-PSP [Pseudomonas saudiphocaensis]